MRKISGNITCNTTQDIPEGCIVLVQVSDTTRACAPAIPLGKKTIENPKKFPIQFEVEYDDSFLSNPMGYDYSISARIEQNGQLKFINDTRFIIMDTETQKAKDSIDFFVIEIK
jgi:putative lipoprotein